MSFVWVIVHARAHTRTYTHTHKHWRTHTHTGDAYSSSDYTREQARTHTHHTQIQARARVSLNSVGINLLSWTLCPEVTKVMKVRGLPQAGRGWETDSNDRVAVDRVDLRNDLQPDKQTNNQKCHSVTLNVMPYKQIHLATVFSSRYLSCLLSTLARFAELYHSMLLSCFCRGFFFFFTCPSNWTVLLLPPLCLLSWTMQCCCFAAALVVFFLPSLCSLYGTRRCCWFASELAVFAELYYCCCFIPASTVFDEL